MSIFNNKYSLASIKSLDDTKKLKLIGFLIILTISTWFLFVYSRINKQITKNTNLLQQINTKNALIEQSSNKCSKLENKIANLRSEINESECKDIKKEIINYAKEAGLSLKSYLLIESGKKTEQTKEPISTQEQQEKSITQQMQQETVSYEFTGKIDQIMTFCHKICLSKSCLECKEIYISKKTESESNIKCTIKLLKQNKAAKK